ncbi:MAG: tRNA (N(6)-L-threonylcarbamoyladenosine(37)-C(2))-methylthiotransferase MtaB [Bacilli bacterium]
MKVSYYSLGCKVNEYESVAIINEFMDNGFELVGFQEKADVAIINTCTVTNTSDSKSRKIIRQAVKNNQNGVVAVMGCFAQLNPLQVKEIEGVDIILGTKNRHLLYSLAIDALKTKNPKFIIEDISKNRDYEEIKINRYNNHTRGFIKIEDGCDNFCSYCAIPYARGRVRSRLPEDVINEISHLSQNGMKEVVLTGINTGAYGKDLNGYSFENLLSDLVSRVDNLPRIRISSLEMTEITDGLLNIINVHKDKFCNHFHIPLQGGANNTLKRMNRKYTTEEYKEKINKIRNVFPDANITTDVMVGFPGETASDFEETKKFIDSINYGEMHVFPYSRRPNTRAYDFVDQVDDITKKFRTNELLNLSREKAIEFRKQFVGKRVEVLVEKVQNGICYGHSSNYLNVKFESITAKNNDLVLVELTDYNYPISSGKEIINV